MYSYSIIIPTFNRVGTIGRAIQSCLDQNREDLEVIVVDDGSSDGTAEYLKSITVDNFIYIFQENQGASAARNKGLSLARGRYICYLDSDDFFVVGRFDVLDFYRSHMDSGFVVCSRVLIRRAFSESVSPVNLYSSDFNFSEYIFCYDGFFSTPGIVFSRALASQVLWDVNLGYGDDTDYVIRLKNSGMKFLMLEDVLTIVDDSDVFGRLSLKKDFQAVNSWYDKHKIFLTDRSDLAFKVKHLSFHGFWIRPFYFSGLFFLSIYRGVFSVSIGLKYWFRSILPVSVYKYFTNFLRKV
ncbi:glycosyltransferase family 2 protein [Microbulbifer sp. SSSA002]|uniref:glycosyltransferase family 2 protein n=1 Tax=unclassified Microbulbifer TaxID=2619833 RepID=UPI004039978D